MFVSHEVIVVGTLQKSLLSLIRNDCFLQLEMESSLQTPTCNESRTNICLKRERQFRAETSQIIHLEEAHAGYKVVKKIFPSNQMWFKMF